MALKVNAGRLSGQEITLVDSPVENCKITIMIKLQGIYINLSHVSMATLKEDNTVVVDFNYCKGDEPVFLAFRYNTKDEAVKALSEVVGHDVSAEYLD